MGLRFPKLILLLGMDGTGELFADFIKALPVESEAEVLRYPADRFLSYKQLMALAQSVLPASEPFVLVAEFFDAPRNATGRNKSSKPEGDGSVCRIRHQSGTSQAP